VTAHVLRHEGHSVIEACDGKVGLELFQTSKADLVITDMVMPEVEGFEVLAELRKEKTHVKIIAMSGGGRQNPTDHLRMAAHMGATVLKKPFSTDALIAAVNGLIPAAVPTSQTST